MKRKLILFLLYLSLVPTKISADRSLPYLVSAQWLAEHLNDKNLVILQVGFSRNEFKYGHVPNARFLWFNSLAPSNPDLNSEMPGIEEGKKILEELGITNNSNIVLVFTGQNLTITTRMILALSYFGFGEQTALLDGGLEGWKGEGRIISKDTPAIQRTSLDLNIDPSVITDAEWIKNHLSAPDVVIVDARSKNFYDGSGGGIARQGHIKGAVNIPFSVVSDSTNKIKPVDELRKIFDDAGITMGKTVIAYCHVGQQATLIYYAAKYLGYIVKVYDGSFEDWNVRDESYPVEKVKAVK